MTFKEICAAPEHVFWKRDRTWIAPARCSTSLYVVRKRSGSARYTAEFSPRDTPDDVWIGEAGNFADVERLCEEYEGRRLASIPAED